MARKLFYYDLETTGLKYWENSVHQISGIIEINGKVVEEFDFHVRPHENAAISDEALKVGNVTLEQIMSYPSVDEVHMNIISMLSKYVDRYNKRDKMFLVGYNNASFDNNFFKAFFDHAGDKYFHSWFWSVPLDVIVLAQQKMMDIRPDMENFKLYNVARTLGISVDEEKLHDAFYDIYLTRAIYKIVTDGTWEGQK